MSGRKAPLAAGLREAVAFLPKAWANAWGALVLSGAAACAPLAFDALGGVPFDLTLFGLIAPLTLLMVGVLVDGALYRLSVTGSAEGARALGLGVGGLQFNRPEWRLLAANILVGLFLVVVAFGLGLPLMFVVYAAGVTGIEWSSPADLAYLVSEVESWRLVLVGAAGLAAVVVIWGLVVKLSLYKAATVGRRRVVSLDALALAEGSVLRLFAGLAILSLPSVLVALWQLNALGSLGGAWEPLFRGEIPSRALLQIFAVQALVGAFLQKPLVVGFLGACYNRLEYVGVESAPVAASVEAAEPT